MGKTDGDIATEFTQYVTKVRPRLQRTAYLMCGDWHLADDLTQETLITLYRKWEALDPAAEPTAYAVRILVHKVRRSSRRAWRSHEVMVPPPDLPALSNVSELSDREAIARAMSRLGPRQRAIVVLRYWEDMSVEETARAVGCAQSTVTSQSHRALATLRALLGPIVNSREA